MTQPTPDEIAWARAEIVAPWRLNVWGWGKTAPDVADRDLAGRIATALAAERAKREELAYLLVASEGERELERERAEAAEINFQSVREATASIE